MSLDLIYSIIEVFLSYSVASVGIFSSEEAEKSTTGATSAH